MLAWKKQKTEAFGIYGLYHNYCKTRRQLLGHWKEFIIFYLRPFGGSMVIFIIVVQQQESHLKDMMYTKDGNHDDMMPMLYLLQFFH